MDRVNGNNTVDIGGGRRGFKSQNAAAGIAGTEVTDKILNDVQEEICAVVENAGLVLDPENQQQLWEALQLVAAPGFANRVSWLPVISMAITAPPAGAALGDTYLIPAGATGVWAGNQQKLAEWTGSAWRIVTTKNGHGISLPDGRIFEKIAGTYVEKLALDAQSGKWTYAVAAGTANALTVTLNPNPSSYDSLNVLWVLPKYNSVAGALTINVNGLGAVPITVSGELPVAGLLRVGIPAMLVRNSDGYTAVLSNPGQAGRRVAVFNTAGTQSWIVPQGVFGAWVDVWGAGGGGTASSTYKAGEGGGGGEYRSGWVDLTPGDSIAISIGAGGAQSPALNTDASPGGPSSFGTYITAMGGGAGTNSPAAPGLGGTGGAGGQIGMAGQCGDDGWNNLERAFSNGGDAGGGGGKGGTNGTPVVLPSWPGGGGMGFYTSSDASRRVSAGAAGGIIVRY